MMHPYLDHRVYFWTLHLNKNRTGYREGDTDDVQNAFLKEQLSGAGLSILEKMQLKELR